MSPFSERYNHQPADAEITIREDASEALRYAILQLAVDNGLGPSTLREIACGILFAPPDRGNWSALLDAPLSLVLPLAIAADAFKRGT